MRIGILGAGSVGTYLGGRLLASGFDVTLVGRTALGEEIRRHGIHLTDLAGRETIVPPDRVSFTTEVSAVAASDAILVTVKGFDTESVATELGDVLTGGTLIVSFQNGVRNADVIRRILPTHPVLSGMVAFNVVRHPEARFQWTTRGPLVVERQDGVEAPLLEALRTAGFRVSRNTNMRGVLWGKLLLNLNNAINALAGIPLRTELSDRAYRRVLAAAIDEGLSVLGATGIHPERSGNLIPSITPFLLRLPNWLFLRAARAMLSIRPDARSSMADDLERGQRTEVDFLNGEIVRLGKEVGVPTPVNDRIVSLLHEAERRGAGSPRLSAPVLQHEVGLDDQPRAA